VLSAIDPRDVILHVRLGKTYHAGCAERVRAGATVKKPTIIGHIDGTARTFDRQGDRAGCKVVNWDGTAARDASRQTHSTRASHAANRSSVATMIEAANYPDRSVDSRTTRDDSSTRLRLRMDRLSDRSSTRSVHGASPLFDRLRTWQEEVASSDDDSNTRAAE